MSSFQALATAIAAQAGTGNVVGASGAILTGGILALTGTVLRGAHFRSGSKLAADPRDP